MIRRFLTALLIGGTVFAVTTAFHLDPPWRLMLATFVGGSVLVVRFLAELEDRLMAVETQQTHRLEAMEQDQEVHASKIETLVQDGFAKINHTTELFGLMEASALRPDSVIQLAQHATRFPKPVSLVSRLAEQEILRTSRFLKELSDGSASYEGEDRDWLLALTELAQESIYATSLNTVDTRGNALDSSFWQSDLGQRYLRAQHRRTRNGVKVRRLFIVDRPDIGSSPDFLTMCQKQTRLRIEVRILDTDADDEELSDFVLFDNTVVYETIPATAIDSLPGILHTQVQLRPDLVTKRVEQYRELWDAARPFLPD